MKRTRTMYARICSNRSRSGGTPPTGTLLPPHWRSAAPGAARGRGVLTSEQTSVGTDATRTVIHPSSSLTQSFHHALAQRHDVTGEDTLSSRVAGKSYSSTLSVPAAEATCKFRGTNAALDTVWLQDPQRAKRYRHAPKGLRPRPFPPWSGCLPCCRLSQT